MRQVRVLQIEDVAHQESKNEVLLNTNANTQLHIISKNRNTYIKLPYGNKFDVVDGIIIIHEKY